MKRFKRSVPLALCLALAATATHAQTGKLEQVATFDGPMPTGVAVSREGRVFVNFPRWVDAVQYTVAELRDGRPIPFPSAEFNRYRPEAPGQALVSVQSVVIDSADRLWMLDTGNIFFGPNAKNGPKLVGVDLKTNEVVKTIGFPTNVALPTTYLNDVRFDLRRGAEGVAYITDSSGKGSNGIIVVDLASGESRRRLNDHPSTRPEPNFTLTLENRSILEQRPVGRPRPIQFGADGIAISADGARLFYCPVSSRRLYSVSTDALLDAAKSDEDVAATIQDHGEKVVSDGLESDAQGRIYLTDVETYSLRRRRPEGGDEVLANDPRLIWPDTMSLAADGNLYVIANQLHRQPQYNNGRDLREKPYGLFRVRTDGTPVNLAR